jgi:hypothetical protein
MSKPRKLRLDLQDLRVESFDPTVRAAGSRGTVFGRNETQQTNCYTFYDGCNYTPGGTCYQSCVDTCYGTCPGVGGCEPYEPTQEPTCLGATCYWVLGAAYYDGNC